MLPKIHRYTTRKEISQVLQKGSRIYSSILTIYIFKNTERQGQPWRLAVVVGKKSVAKLATARNLVKRQISNAFYLESGALELQGLDLAITAKKTILNANFESIKTMLIALLAQTRLGAKVSPMKQNPNPSKN